MNDLCREMVQEVRRVYVAQGSPGVGLAAYTHRVLGGVARRDPEALRQDCGAVITDLLDYKKARAAGFAVWSKMKLGDDEAMKATINAAVQTPVRSRRELVAWEWRYLAFHWEECTGLRYDRAREEGPELLFSLHESGRWWDCWSTSGESYEVTPQSCSCPDWVCQPAGDTERKPRACWHMLALRAGYGERLCGTPAKRGITQLAA